MRKYLFETVLGAALGAGIFAVAKWQSEPRLSPAEIDLYIHILEKNLPAEMEDRAEFIARMRAWGENDDGRPVYMLNLMRFYKQIKSFPGVAAVSTPEEANAIYEKAATPMLLKRGGYPTVVGATMGIWGSRRPESNLMVYQPEKDNWDRMLVVRYPGRRTFFELVSNPEYLKVVPNKLASLEVILTPVRADMVIPDVRLAAGALAAVIFLAAGWIRAAKRSC